MRENIGPDIETFKDDQTGRTIRILKDEHGRMIRLLDRKSLKIVIPDWQSTKEKIDLDVKLTPLENLIYYSEPSDKRDAEDFRIGLAAAIKWVMSDK